MIQNRTDMNLKKGSLIEVSRGLRIWLTRSTNEANCSLSIRPGSIIAPAIVPEQLSPKKKSSDEFLAFKLKKQKKKNYLISNLY